MKKASQARLAWVLFILIGSTWPWMAAGKDLLVTDFGALGDGRKVDTRPIQAALDAAGESGGGVVRIPAGTYLTGSLMMRSHVCLHLDEGATLTGTANAADYPLVTARWEGVDAPCHRALIWGDKVEDVSVEGAGVIIGNAAMGALRSPRGVPVVEFLHGHGIRVEGLTLQSTHMWTLHPEFCEDVTVKAVRFQTIGSNSDGIDPDSCHHVLIDGCIFSTGDDNIAIKSGKGVEGRRAGIPSEDIVITHCRFIKGYTSVALGSELSGGIRNVWIGDCEFGEGHAALELKSRAGRGGYAEQVWMTNVVVEREPLLEITANYSFNPDPQGIEGAEGYTRFRGIQVEGARVEGPYLMRIDGASKSVAEGVTLRNVTGQCRQSSRLSNVRGLNLEGVRVRVKSGPDYLTNNVEGNGIQNAAPLDRMRR